MEVIICTPTNSGLLDDDICQKSAPEKSLNGSKRGSVKGDAPKNKNKEKLDYSSKINSNTLLNPSWVGGFVALILVIGSLLVTPYAHAADQSWNNTDLTKKVVENVAPVVSSETNQDQKLAISTTPTQDYIEKPLVVETQITPEPKLVLGTRTARADYSLVKGPHYFPYGYCTYYVSQKRTVTWSGNAGTWISGAKLAGLETGRTAKVGAIVVTSEGGKTGHVAYVESVDGDKITVSEMNFKGYGVVSTRTIAANSKVIRGFIY